MLGFELIIFCIITKHFAKCIILKTPKLNSLAILKSCHVKEQRRNKDVSGLISPTGPCVDFCYYSTVHYMQISGAFKSFLFCPSNRFWQLNFFPCCGGKVPDYNTGKSVSRGERKWARFSTENIQIVTFSFSSFPLCSSCSPVYTDFAMPCCF